MTGNTEPRARLALALLLVALSGTLPGACTSDRLERSEAAGIQTIRLLAPPEPRRYDVNVFASPATGLRIGVYDAVLAHDIMRAPEPGDADASLTAALADEAGLRLGAELVDAIDAHLAGAGYHVTRERGAGDAELVVTPLFAGYVDQPFRPYTPLLLVEIRLESSGAKSLLFRQRYNYGMHPYLADDRHFVPDPRFTFPDKASLLADPARAAEGLRAAMPLIAADLASRINRPAP